MSAHLPTIRRRIPARLRRMSTEARPTLPRLPVPPLQQTIDRYLKSLEPFLLEDDARGGPSFTSSYNLREKWAQEFRGGVGKLCQQRLIDLDKKSPNNWLNDTIWMKKAYLEWREPLLINSNWWLAFQNDDNVSDDVLNSLTRGNIVGITPWQVRRAAWLVHRILDFKERLDCQELYPDTTPTGIWLRHETARIFNVCRIPREGTDTLSRNVDPASPNARRLFVMLHDWCYAIDVYDESRNRASFEEIEIRLCQVVRDVEKREAEGERAVPIGVLSADGRDRWAKNLAHLLPLSQANATTLSTIEGSLMALSLDHYTLTPASSTVAPQPNTPQEIDAHLHNIRSAAGARNRWFDKSFTLIVESNTRAGAMGEHSPCDALVPSIVCEYALVQGVDWNTTSSPLFNKNVEPGYWTRLDWVTDDYIEHECIEAEKRANQVIQESDDSVLLFQEYGADWIKDAKFSPDAYIQMVLQFAWYKTRGYFTATYETALTRLFAHGRTETIRAFTNESRAWVLQMMDPKASLSSRHELLHRAVRAHVALTQCAVKGRGIDRHLLGLRLMLRPGERCELFEDELFARSQKWELSTSGLSAGLYFRGTGATEPSGYGINYLAAPSTIKFGIESKVSCPDTSTAEFKEAVVNALREMKLLCEGVQEEGPISTSKL